MKIRYRLYRLWDI